MIQNLVSEAVKDTDAVKSLISVHEHLRRIAASNDSAETQARQNAAVAMLLMNLPDDTAFRLLEHCSTLTRLYAIWERFVAQAVKLWLVDLPSYHGAYAELGNGFASNHRRGVGRILLDLDKDRFSHISAEQAVSGFMAAVTGDATYTILPEAFLFDNRSLRRERLEELFTQVRLEGVWHWIAETRFVQQFLSDIRGGQNTADSELRTFINFRNEAAHGNVDEVLGTVPLIETADFIIALCRAIGEFILWHQVSQREKAGQLVRIGQVTEKFSNNVVVAKLAACRISVGNVVFLHGTRYCYPASIISIRLNDVPHDSISVDDEREVGLKFDVEPQKSPKVFLEVPV